MSTPKLILLMAGLAVAGAITGCGTAATASSRSPARASTAPPAPAPVSTTATLSGSCVMGGAIWVNSTGSYSGFETAGWDFPVLGLGPSGVPNSQDQPVYPAPGYQVTLKDTAQVTAQVGAFSVIFYDKAGTELGSDSEATKPTLIAPGQSLTWTMMSNTTTIGDTGLPGDGGPAGQDSSIPDDAASCQFSTWSQP